MQSNSLYCDGVMCSTADWSLTIELQACDRHGIVNVTDKKSGGSSHHNFSTDLQDQTLSHNFGNFTGNFNLTSGLVLHNGKNFYLISLKFPLLNTSFPTTAIPVECPGNMKQSFTFYYASYYSKCIENNALYSMKTS